MRNSIAISALLAVVAASPAAAEPRTTIAIGNISSEQECTIYQGSAGRRDVYANPWEYASSTSWVTWLYRDCVDRFASLRTALEAALASSGTLAVGRGPYTLSGNISGVSGSGGPAPYAPDRGPRGYSVSSAYMMANMDVTLRDRSGKIVFGDLVTKRIESGSDINVNGFRATSTQSGQALYAVLQRAISLAVARKVAFHLAPMRVIDNSGRNIRLNYGTPMVEMGSMIEVTSLNGQTVMRYRVTSASPGSAMAEPYSDGNREDIVPGSRAVLIESDDPAANGRRFQKVELP